MHIRRVASEPPARLPESVLALLLAGVGRGGQAAVDGVAADAEPAVPSPSGAKGFPARVQWLGERAGGMDALAQCCGVTARTVRNWCGGRSDISRERCVALARAQRVSLLWLVSGEGTMAGDPPVPVRAGDAPDHRAGVAPGLLADALRLVQSYLVLTGGALSVMRHAEAVAELYGLLAKPGSIDVDGIVAFHERLAAGLRGPAPPVT